MFPPLGAGSADIITTIRELLSRASTGSLFCYREHPIRVFEFLFEDDLLNGLTSSSTLDGSPTAGSLLCYREHLIRVFETLFEDGLLNGLTTSSNPERLSHR